MDLDTENLLREHIKDHEITVLNLIERICTLENLDVTKMEKEEADDHRETLDRKKKQLIGYQSRKQTFEDIFKMKILYGKLCLDIDIPIPYNCLYLNPSSLSILIYEFPHKIEVKDIVFIYKSSYDEWMLTTRDKKEYKIFHPDWPFFLKSRIMLHTMTIMKLEQNPKESSHGMEHFMQ
jgi:hypothetical protein